MPTLTKRPTVNDSAIIKTAVERLLPDVIEWLNQNGDSTDYEQETEERDSVIDQLTGAIKGSTTDDGYRLARELEHDGWDADSALVEVMDRTSSYLREAVRQASIVWFKESGFTQLVPGTRVKSNQRGDSNGKIGVIRDAYEDGRYSVNISELGHNPMDSKLPGAYGIILDHENLELVK